MSLTRCLEPKWENSRASQSFLSPTSTLPTHHSTHQEVVCSAVDDAALSLGSFVSPLLSNGKFCFPRLTSVRYTGLAENPASPISLYGLRPCSRTQFLRSEPVQSEVDHRYLLHERLDVQSFSPFPIFTQLHDVP